MAEETKKLAEYTLTADNVPAHVTIFEDPDEYVPVYKIQRVRLEKATELVLGSIREKVITTVPITTKEFVDTEAVREVKEKFKKKALELVDSELPGLSSSQRQMLAGVMVHEMIGLGDIELLLKDDLLEEIVVNNSREPLWVFHKHFGWLKTNITFEGEEQIYNYTSSIGRRVGRQITNLHPLMDAHLFTGDRVNATIFPISTRGNTLTIRLFSRSPWTIINLIDPKIKSMSSEIAALIWLAVQYELNTMVVGGTASGKTSMLNAILPFIPPNQRIISIEDTREIQLPEFLHWVPFSSREPNPEGKGGVEMLDLLVNSLRMRPDRIVVGEVRREREAEVMFEAIRTGHTAYSTFHADRADQAYKRLTNPPMNLPEPLLGALHLMIVQYRHRRKGIRRTLEVAELIPTEDMTNKMNVIYRWNPNNDEFEKVGHFLRIENEIGLYTGMNSMEIEEDLKKKKTILEWMLKRGVNTVNTVGKVMAEYYLDENKVFSMAKHNKPPDELLGRFAAELKGGV